MIKIIILFILFNIGLAEQYCSMRTYGVNNSVYNYHIDNSWHYTSEQCPFLQECWIKDTDGVFGYTLFGDSKNCTEPGGIKCLNTTGGCSCEGECQVYFVWVLTAILVSVLSCGLLVLCLNSIIRVFTPYQLLKTTR